MDLELRGKQVLITGGSKGIGLACAQGCGVIVNVIGVAGRPSEVADLVVYLASARASYISGTIVTIDCGQSMRPRP